MKIRALMLSFALAVFALPSFGQVLYEEAVLQEDTYDGGSSGTYQLGTYMENPCTAVEDWVLVDYDVSLYEEYWQSTAGERFYFSENTYMGSTTYSASGSTESDVAYTPSFTLRKYHKVNTYDNFHVVTVIDFDPATRSSYLSVETACGNGMPDSAE